MRILFAILLSAAGATLVELNAPRAAAHDYGVGALTIGHPIVAPTPGGSTMTAGYMTITNSGDSADRLISAVSPAAERVEIHQISAGEGGVMRMQAVEGGVAIPAGGSASFAPGGLHLMLSGLSAPLARGDTVTITLTFANAGSIDVIALVERPGHGHGNAHNH